MIRGNINSYVKILGNVKKRGQKQSGEFCRTLMVDCLAIYRYSD